MKNILIGSLAFFLFSISVSILQTGCDKDATADPNTTNEIHQLNKVFYLKTVDGTQSYNAEIWTANYDGNNQTRINITLPGNFKITGSEGPKVSPDGQKIFFTGYNSTGYFIFSCNLDGSNVKKLFEIGSEGSLGGAY